MAAVNFHPEHLYRQAFLAELMGRGLSSLLEAGSGAGTFLRAAHAVLPRVVGSDPQADRADALVAEGLEARVAHAEALPFADGAFDAVAFAYTAHHIADWPAALAEALRVARRTVAILDPWYDESLPSQQVGLAYDRWNKALDRAGGMVHHDCLSAGSLLAPLAARTDLRVSVQHRLVLQASDLAQCRDYAAKQLANAAQPERWRAELEAIWQRAARDGMSEDGAIVVLIDKLHATG